MAHQLQPHGLGAISLGHPQARALFFEDLIENGRAQQGRASPFGQRAMKYASLQQEVQPVARQRRTPPQPQRFAGEELKRTLQEALNPRGT